MLTFILESLHDEWLFLAIEPKLAECFHCWIDAINHPENANGWADFGVLADVVISAEQLEGAVGRLKSLPINIVELEIEDAWVLGTLLRIFAVRLSLNGLVLCPVRDW